MQKYYVYFDDLCNEKPAPRPGFTDHEVYLVSDADAHAEELRSERDRTVAVLKGDLDRAQQAIQRMAAEAKAQDEKIRSLMVTGAGK